MAEDSLQTIWTAHTSPPPPPRPPSSPMRALPPSPSLAPHTSLLSLAPCRPSAAWSPPHPLSLSRMAALAQTPLPRMASSTATPRKPSKLPPQAQEGTFSWREAVACRDGLPPPPSPLPVTWEALSRQRSLPTTPLTALTLRWAPMPPATSCIMTALTGHGLVLAPQATSLPMSAARPPGSPLLPSPLSLARSRWQTAAPAKRSPLPQAAPYTATLTHWRSPQPARQDKFS